MHSNSQHDRYSTIRKPVAYFQERASARRTAGQCFAIGEDKGDVAICAIDLRRFKPEQMLAGPQKKSCPWFEALLSWNAARRNSAQLVDRRQSALFG